MADANSTPSSDQSWGLPEIGDLSQVTAIVTGANSGLGLRTAVHLAAHGAEVVLACRDTGKGTMALADLLGELPEARAELRRLDLADLSSVRRFAREWDGRPLDLLINNAGVMAIPRRVSPDGFEMQLATNHLGHFALTGLLLPALLGNAVAGGPPRVVTVSSFLHRTGRLHLDDLMLEHGYSPWRAYGQSKLANLLFMRELDRRAAEAGVPLASLAAHPGYAATNLASVGPAMRGRAALGQALLGRSIQAATRLLGQSADQGSLPILRAATDPQAAGGEYFGPGGPGELRGAPTWVGMAGQALDPVAAALLWERSVELTGVDYAVLNQSPAT